MGRETGDAALHPLALAVADINWFTTESLFQELDHPSVDPRASVHGLPERIAAWDLPLVKVVPAPCLAPELRHP